MNKCIGVIGGMGPLATCDFMKKLLLRMDAKSDQDFIRICVDCNTNIPDRTAAILGKGENPLPEMIKSAIRLQCSGADVLTISCNTAHYFVEELSKCIDVPIMHMPLLVAEELKRRNINTAAVLATDGTVQSGVYEKVLHANGIQAVYPDQTEQAFVMSLIYDYVKAGKPFDTCREQILALIDHMKFLGAEVMILGCTELPIVFDQLHINIATIDPTDVLACAAIRYCGGVPKEQF